MNYWWVNQGKGWVHESAGGYIFAPKRDGRGVIPAHWISMLDVAKGDVIFSYQKKAILATGSAMSIAVDGVRPYVFDDARPWLQEGRRIDVAYQILEKPLKVPGLLTELMRLTPRKNSPFCKNGWARQGYLFPLPIKAAQLLLNRIGSSQQSPKSTNGADAAHGLRPTHHRIFVSRRHERAPYWMKAATDIAVCLLKCRATVKERIRGDELRVYERVFNELLGRTIWKYSEAYGKTTGNLFWSASAAQYYLKTGDTKQLRHEHVFPQNGLIEKLKLLDHPTSEKIGDLYAKYAVGVVVHKSEDILLRTNGRGRSTVPGGVDNPWLRYKMPGALIKLKEGSVIPLWHRDKLVRLGMLGPIHEIGPASLGKMDTLPEKSARSLRQSRRANRLPSPSRVAVRSRTERHDPRPKQRDRVLGGPIDLSSRIQVLVSANPKKEGSKAYDRFQLYRDGATVGEFLESGGTLLDVRWDSHHLRRHIRLLPPET